MAVESGGLLRGSGSGGNSGGRGLDDGGNPFQKHGEYFFHLFWQK